MNTDIITAIISSATTLLAVILTKNTGIWNIFFFHKRKKITYEYLQNHQLYIDGMYWAKEKLPNTTFVANDGERDWIYKTICKIKLHSVLNISKGLLLKPAEFKEKIQSIRCLTLFITENIYQIIEQYNKDIKAEFNAHFKDRANAIYEYVMNDPAKGFNTVLHKATVQNLIADVETYCMHSQHANNYYEIIDSIFYFYRNALDCTWAHLMQSVYLINGDLKKLIYG